MQRPKDACPHDKPVLGHCAFMICPNYRSKCPSHAIARTGETCANEPAGNAQVVIRIDAEDYIAAEAWKREIVFMLQANGIPDDDTIHIEIIPAG